ncbi:outer membrane beta-barrel protein [Rufibacter roseolus]|uniref:outer membrane beta-barrel protein n=1 Tax=Rufibacter roseolus TaxID=2817375 RepID=UPI001B303304|nr:outer membrane beta-barrel protein [Rufibacter roseolus]
MISFKYKIAFSLLTFLFLFSEIKAQTDFRPGYIITLQGDTVKGFLNYRSDIANAKNCVFKKEQDQDKIVYTPDQLRAYRFQDGKNYLSSIQFNYRLEEDVFIESVSQGLISVFYYKEDVKDHFFVSKGNQVVELDHHDEFAGTLRNGGINQGQAVPEKFRGQLKYLMWDQPSLHPKIDRASCTIKDLVSLAKAYQQLSSPSQEYVQFEKPVPKGVKSKFGVFVAGGLSHLDSPPYNMYISDYDVRKYLDFKPSFTYEVGVLVDLSLNFIGENKYFLQLAPALNIAEYTSQKELALYPLLYSYKTNIQFTTLKLPLMFKYSFYRSNASVLPFIKFGPGCDIYLNQKGRYEYTSGPLDGAPSQETVYTASLDTTYDDKPIMFYFMGGAGVDIKTGKRPFSIGVTYKKGAGPLDSYRSDIQLQMGFQF